MTTAPHSSLSYVQLAHDDRQHIVRDKHSPQARTLCGRNAWNGWIGGGTFRESLPNLCQKCMAVLRQQQLPGVE